MEVYNDFWKELSPDDCIDIYQTLGVAGDSLATDYIKTVGGLAVKMIRVLMKKFPPLILVLLQ